MAEPHGRVRHPSWRWCRMWSGSGLQPRRVGRGPWTVVLPGGPPDAAADRDRDRRSRVFVPWRCTCWLPDEPKPRLRRRRGHFRLGDAVGLSAQPTPRAGLGVFDAAMLVGPVANGPGGPAGGGCCCSASSIILPHFVISVILLTFREVYRRCAAEAPAGRRRPAPRGNRNHEPVYVRERGDSRRLTIRTRMGREPARWQ